MQTPTLTVVPLLLPLLLSSCPQVPVKKHHFLGLKVAGAVAKAVLSNMDNDVTVEANVNKGNVTEEVTYEPAVPLAAPTPAPAPVVAGVAVPTYPATNETVTASWSG